MTACTIRTALAGDLPALQDIFRRASLSNDGDRDALLGHPEALVLDGRAVAEGRTRLAEIDSVIVGFATTHDHDDCLELEDLFVDPDRFRRGVGRGLVDDASDHARALGLDRVEVTANGHAHGFYSTVGFVDGDPVPTEFGWGLRMRLLVSR